MNNVRVLYRDDRIAVVAKNTLLSQMVEEIERQKDSVYAAMAADALADVMLRFAQVCDHEKGECYCNTVRLAYEGKRFVQVLETPPIEC